MLRTFAKNGGGSGYKLRSFTAPMTDDLQRGKYCRRKKKRIMHGRAEIWNLSSSVHIDIERVSEVNELDIECEHEKINSISPSFHVLFCLLYKHTNNDVFDDFPKISDHFPKISEDFPKLFRRLVERLRTFSEHFPNIFRTFSEHFPKITEDYRR